MAEESRMNRLRPDDRVSFKDESEWPPVQYEGVITGFDNDEMTYLNVKLDTKLGDEKFKGEERVLTEDEVVRIA